LIEHPQSLGEVCIEFLQPSKPGWQFLGEQHPVECPVQRP
jgi:hypothetical protein